MQKNEKLTKMIKEKYPSEAACARSMGWSRQKLNKITTNTREPDLSEVQALAEAIGRPAMEIAQIFLN